jgi:hypothetical protein
MMFAMDVRSLLSAAINCGDGYCVEIIFIATVIYLCAHWILGGGSAEVHY